MDACNLAKKNSLMFSRESKYDPKHENTSEAATFSYLQGHLDATRASKSSNDGKIQLLALQNESIVGGWTFHGRRCSSVILLKGKVCDSGFRKSKEFCGQVVVKRPLLWKDQCKKRFLHVASRPAQNCSPVLANWSKEQRDRKGQKGYIGFTAFAAPSLLGQRLMATNEPTNHLVIGSFEVVPPKARRLDSLWSIRTRSSLPTVRVDKSMTGGCF